MVCQKKKQLKGHVKTNAKANLLPLRRGNSCAKKSNIFAKANMVPVHLSRQLLLAYQRRAELA